MTRIDVQLLSPTETKAQIWGVQTSCVDSRRSRQLRVATCCRNLIPPRARSSGARPYRGLTPCRRVPRPHA